MDAPVESYSADYVAARGRFREAATRVGWTLSAHPIGSTGPGGEDLTIDVARSPGADGGRALVVSSGLHGVEGIFGSAVQLALLERVGADSRWLGGLRTVLVHGLNPYGFAWSRRSDGENIDPNRNFLFDGESFAGSPPGYAQLDGLLNPPRPFRRFDGFYFRALGAILRRGMPALKRAIAGGQYDYPKGLFFGGKGPSRTQQVLRDGLPGWVEGCDRLVHLDFHTGLGPRGTSKLLLDYPPSPSQRDAMARWFGPGSFLSSDAGDFNYQTRGGLGRWCVETNRDRDYLYLCAELGTYPPLAVVAGLRAENQGHHWGPPGDPAAARAKARLRELFCPADPTWRSKSLATGLDLVDRAARGLADR